jgi:hypothetical protein
VTASEDLAAFWFVHTASVQPYMGGGRYGDRWDAPRDVRCFAVAEQTVTTAADGTEVTSTGRLSCSIADGVHFPPGSRVTLPGWDGVVRVIARKTNDPSSLDLPGHVKVMLT